MDDKVDLLLSGQQYKKIQEAYLTPILEEYGINVVDMRVLLFLYEHKSFDTARDIVETHHLAKSYVSKSVDKLIEKGFLVRKHINGDKRYVHLLVKEEMQPAIEAVRKQRNEMLSFLFDGVEEKEMEILKQVAGKVNDNISRLLDKVCIKEVKNE